MALFLSFVQICQYPRQRHKSLAYPSILFPQGLPQRNQNVRQKSSFLCVFAGGAQFEFGAKKLKGLEGPPALEEPNKGFKTPKTAIAVV
jgi:hypothetical protein